MALTGNHCGNGVNNMQDANKCLFLTAISILVISCSIYAGWERTYGWIYDEETPSLKIDRDKNFIMAGGQRQSDFGGSNFFLIKADQYGDSLWAKTYVDTTSSGAYSIELTDHGYIAAGNKSISHEFRPFLVRTNLNGDTLWTRTYEFEAHRGFVLSRMNNGNREYSTLWSYGDNLVIKSDSLGDTIWTSIVGDMDGAAFSMTYAQEGGYIIVGAVGSSEIDLYAAKADSMGVTIWEERYETVGTNRGWFIDTTFDGNYVITGQTSLYYNILFDVYLLKINDDGDTLWTRKYGGDYSDVGRCVRPTTDGGYIITGWTYSYGIGTPDSSNVYLIKTDSLGNLEWERAFGGTGEDKGYSVAQTEDGGYIIAGIYDQGPHIDVYLIKTDSLGYTQIEETYSTRPKELALSAYPNPFNSAVTISAPVGAEIEIFDVNGRRISVISSEGFMPDEKSPTQSQEISPCGRNDKMSEFIWQPDENLGSGVYLVRATVASQTVSKRVVYLK